MWKRAEEAKFKAYLKQKEIERIEDITYAWKAKEADRDKTFTEAMGKVTALEGKVRQKNLDLQRREERIVQLEEELKQRINEVGRQLTVKEEEVMTVKKRFKEERTALETDKKRLSAQVEECKARMEDAEKKLYALRREVDESPLSVLRQELAQKALEIMDMDNKLKTAYEARDDFRKKFETLKRDMVTLKKQMDSEKQQTLVRQSEELEKLKNEMRNRIAQEDERKDLITLKMQVTQLTQKLSESQKVSQQNNTRPDPTINERVGTYNPAYQ